MSNTITIVPHLTCRNAPAAYEFYQKAFGAKPVGIMHTSNGKVMHASLTIGGSAVYLVEEFPDYGGQSPEMLGGSPVTIHLQVSDCDALYDQAVEAGCTVGIPLEDQFWGDRYGMVIDPFGHHWSIATTKRQVSSEELQQAMAAGSQG